MKTILKAVLASVLLATSNSMMAQTSSTTTTTTSSGTVREFGNGAITITSDASTPPVKYAYSKTTTYVDENGNPVSIETVRSGVPVTVYSMSAGGGLVATKVVVRKSVDVSPDGAVTRQTTTTTTPSMEGTVSSLDPETIVIKSDTSPSPQSYTFSKTVTYSDENGNPVAFSTVKTGVPVTVFYDREGTGMVATRVVVRSPDANGTVIQHKKTTTTTTETNPKD